MKHAKWITWTFGIACILLLGGVMISAGAAPGDNDDPVVTKSYVDSAISELRSYVDSKSFSSDGNAQTGLNETYQVVKLADGQKITYGEGAEMILRSGNGTIFSSEKGGLADTTTGTDLQDGAAVPHNHLLIVPLADGRGFTAKGDVLVMVRGQYQIN